MLFSSGSTISVLENTELIVSLFEQEAISGFLSGTVQSLKKEVSKSKTRLVLNYGKLYSNIKKLNPDSEFSIKSQTGVAGIRGAEIIFDVSKAGSSFSVLNGSADFSDGINPIQESSHKQTVIAKGGKLVKDEISDENLFSFGSYSGEVSAVASTVNVTELSESLDVVSASFSFGSVETIPVYGDNLLVNGSFEKKLKGGYINNGDKQTGIDSQKNAPEGKRVMELVSDPKYESTKVKQAGLVHQVVEVEGGKKYKCSCFFKVDEAEENFDGIHIYVENMDKGFSKTIANLSAEDVVGKGWIYSDVEFIIPKGLKLLTVKFCVKAKIDKAKLKQVAYFDNFQLREIISD